MENQIQTKSLDDIMEDITKQYSNAKLLANYDDSSKKIVLLYDTNSPTKYIHARDKNQKEYIVALPIEGGNITSILYKNFELKNLGHKGIVDILSKVGINDLSVLGGGMVYKKDKIHKNLTKNQLLVSGGSGNYGDADHKHVAEILRSIDIDAIGKTLDEYNVEYWGEK